MRILSKSCVALAAVSVLGISVNASTLQDAIKNGTTGGEIRSITVKGGYTDRTEIGPYNNANSSAIALRLDHETADISGFKAQVGFQTSHSLDTEEGSKTWDAPNFYNEVEGRITQEGSNLYLANISYAAGNTVVKAGKQNISTTLMARSNANPLVDTYNALSIVNKDIPNTEVQFYAVKDWLERYSTTDDSRIHHYETPVYSLVVKNTSIDNLTLEGQYLGVNDEHGNPKDAPVATDDSYKTYYGAFTYKLPTSTPLSIGSFYAVADYDSSTVGGYLSDDEDTNMFGIKVGGKIYDTPFKVAYTKVNDDGDFIGNFGHVPNFFKYNGGQMYTDNIFAGQSSTSVMVIPKLIPGIFSLFAYSSYSQSDAGIANSSRGNNMDGASEFQADLRYKFTGEADGLTARLQLGYVNFDDSSVADDTLTISKLYLIYKF